MDRANSHWVKSIWRCKVQSDLGASKTAPLSHLSVFSFFDFSSSGFSSFWFLLVSHLLISHLLTLSSYRFLVFCSLIFLLIILISHLSVFFCFLLLPISHLSVLSSSSFLIFPIFCVGSGEASEASEMAIHWIHGSESEPFRCKVLCKVWVSDASVTEVLIAIRRLVTRRRACVVASNGIHCWHSPPVDC